jgi:hypothetical protein
MSQLSRERGEVKREEIRRILFSIAMECVRAKQTRDECMRQLTRHAGVMKNAKPQESCLVQNVILEIGRDMPGFLKRQQERANAARRAAKAAAKSSLKHTEKNDLQLSKV